MGRPERQVVITSNSPGEVATWLRPFLPELRRREPDAEIAVFLPPCTFASGSERPVVESYPEVDLCVRPSEVLQYVLLGRRPRGFEPGRRGAVLFLGGDMVYAVGLGRRLGFPAFAYTEGRIHWSYSFRRFFVPDEGGRQRALRDGASPEQVEVVGDLMADAVRLPGSGEAAGERQGAASAARADVATASEGDAAPPRLAPRRGAGGEGRRTGEGRADGGGYRLGVGGEGGSAHSGLSHRVALFPGSRPAAVRHMLPFMLRVAEEVSGGLPDVEFVVSLSPFASWEDAADACRQRFEWLEGSRAHVEPWHEAGVEALAKVGAEAGADAGADAEGLRETDGTEGMEGGQSLWARLETEGGVRLWAVRGRPHEAMRWADLGVTIPGSNTAEMGHLALPMLVLLPLNRPELLPLEGFPGVLGSLPAVGKAIKRAAVRRVERQTTWISLPNRKADKEVVPEMRGSLQAQGVADRVIRLFEDAAGRRETSEALAQAMGSPGAARRIAERVVEEGIGCHRCAG